MPHNRILWERSQQKHKLSRHGALMYGPTGPTGPRAVPDSPTRAFLRANFDEYLVRDLRAMIEAAPQKWDSGGGFGFPIVMTVFAGIELLGELLGAAKYPKGGTGDKALLRYWTQYLYPSAPDSEKQALALYRAARHGIAHLFMLKGSLAVCYNQRAYHLRQDSAGTVYIDAKCFALDFIDSYEIRFLPILDREASDPLRVRVETRASELSSVLQQTVVASVFGPAVGPPLPRSGNLPTGFIGASGPMHIATSATASAAFMPVFPPPTGA